MEETLYKFRGTNLADYLQDRRFLAKKKRGDAVILVKEAEAIENETYKLEIILLEVKNGAE